MDIANLGLRLSKRKIAQCSTKHMDHSLADLTEMPHTLHMSFNQMHATVLNARLYSPSPFLFSLSVFRILLLPSLNSVPRNR